MSVPVREPTCEIVRMYDRLGWMFCFAFSDGAVGKCHVDSSPTPQAIREKLEGTFRDGTARGAQRWRDVMASLPAALDQMRSNGMYDRLARGIAA